MKNKKLIGGLIGIILWMLIAFIHPPEGLDQVSMIVLGSIVCAVVYWIMDVMPDFAVGLFMCLSWVVFGVTEFKVAFAQFSGTSWWMVIGALGIGVAVSETGLMKRLALYIMRLFPTNFKGQSLAVLLAGVLVSPTIPSTNAKGSIAAPLALSISDTMGYERKSKASAGIFMGMFYGFVCASPIFLSATFMNYVGRGLLEESIQAQLTWGNWFLYALPWSVIFLVGSYLGIQRFYKPDTEVALPDGFIQKQIDALGKMSREEITTALILAITLVMWMFERVTGLSSAVVALLALAALIGLNVITVPQFKKGIPWNAVIFIGCALNLGTILPAVGIDKWIAASLSGVLMPVTTNPYLFVILLALIIYGARFLLVSLTAAVTLFVLMVLPLVMSTDIHPFIVIFTIITSVNIWVLPYQNPPFLTTYYAINGSMSTDKQNRLGALIYMGLNLVGLLVSVGFWQLIGLIG